MNKTTIDVIDIFIHYLQVINLNKYQKLTVLLSVTETSSRKNLYAEQIKCKTSICVILCVGYVASLKLKIALMLLFGILLSTAKDCWHGGVDAHIHVPVRKLETSKEDYPYLPTVNQIKKKRKYTSLSENLYKNINCNPSFPFRLKKLNFLFCVFKQTLKIMLLVFTTILCC